MLCQSLSKINTLEKVIILFASDYVPPCWVIFCWFISFSVSPEVCRMLLSLHKYGLKNCDHHRRMDETVFSYQKSKGYDVYGS